MPKRSPDQTGVLIVRIWRESGDVGEFRARTMRRLDATMPAQATTMASSPEALYEIVREWVDAFLGIDEDPPAEPTILSR